MSIAGRVAFVALPVMPTRSDEHPNSRPQMAR